MSALLPRLLLIAGFCLGAVGASGFGEEVESLAWPFFLAGVLGTMSGGLLVRRQTRRAAAAGDAGDPLSRAGLAAALAEIACEVVRLDDEKETVPATSFCARIDDLLTGACFETGGRNEDYARLLGPALFASIWEGFAVSERLLARAWSMATDGHLDEARTELSRARLQILAATAAASGSRSWMVERDSS